MVKSRRFAIAAATLGLSATFGMGCRAVWWGEAPPPPHVIHQASSTGDCMSPSVIVTGNDAESNTTLECWAQQNEKIWTQIQGRHKDSLTDAEAVSVLKSGIVKLPGNQDQSIDQILAAKQILGFSGPISRTNLAEWIQWMRTNRSNIRYVYHQFFLTESGTPFKYSDIELAFDVVSAFFRKIKWTKDTNELSTLFLRLTQTDDRDIRRSALPGAKVILNITGMVCPTSSQDKLDTVEVASCLEQLGKHFEPAKMWIEFLINPIRDIDDPKVAKLHDSLDQTGYQIERWFDNPKLKPLKTMLLFDLAKSMGANPPDDFLDSLAFVRRFNEGSTERSIQPIFMVRTFSLFKQMQREFIEGLPVFLAAQRNGTCVNPGSTSWRTCVITDTKDLRARIPALDMAFRVKNSRHGQIAAPMDGARFTTLTLFDAMTWQLFEAFAPENAQVLTTDLNNDKDEVLQLLTASLETFQGLQRYISNISRRVRNEATVDPNDHRITLDQWNQPAFARLVALSNDTLVERTKEQTNFLDNFIATFTNNNPTSAIYIDRPALTAIFNVLSEIGSYRNVTLHALFPDYTDEQIQDLQDQDIPFPRTRLTMGLRTALRQNFPRTEAGCNQFGFDRSCGIAFDKIIPETSPNSGMIRAVDLDIITAIGMGLEGVFDTCDTDGDFKLSASPLNGNDELDCGFVKMKDIVQRLMDSRLLKVAPKDQEHVNWLLNTLNSMFFTRGFGKAALINGTTSGLAINVIVPVIGNATIGSAYGLFSYIADEDRSKAADAQMNRR